MPCFKGIAVSVHANGAPLPEHGVQRQSRFSRINSYIPVPQPQLNTESNKPEPARFAISITLLTPGLAIPYSTPKPTDDNPRPKPQYVGPMPSPADRGRPSSVSPYIPMTNSSNETIAAYIYFDGRAKEEVATLLRPGEETWVNSRWVQVPESEGGGLAEREFLFREVGLERWLNGLDLKGHDAAEKLERRRQKFERRRRRQQAAAAGLPSSNGTRDTLRYGTDDGSPIEPVLDDDDSLSDDDDDDDDIPEATGQIKVAMFRVLASGEIKKGEYSPQFDAHDDDDDANASSKTGAGIDADVEHTTSFAKPKSLDPSTISTQTVTGIDGPEKPYATFTFFYRGERQLQKIGVIAPKSSQPTPGSAKRRSGQLDFSTLGPLKTSGTVGFSAFRDHAEASRRKARKKSNGDVSAMQELSDDDEDDEDESGLLGKMKDIDDKEMDTTQDPALQGELADGVNRMKLKRAHSADPESIAASDSRSNTPGGASSLSKSGLSPPDQSSTPEPNPTLSKMESPAIGSPMKKHRPSISGPNPTEDPATMKFAGATPSMLGMDEILAKAGASSKLSQPPLSTVDEPKRQGLLPAAMIEEEEEL